jgi:hypothetical protein
MKVKRIQKKQPLEKNKWRRAIKGTKLEVKKPKKKKNQRNTDPNAYIDVKPIEFDPYDLRGRSTLKVSLLLGLLLTFRSVDICPSLLECDIINDQFMIIYGKASRFAN